MNENKAKPCTAIEFGRDITRNLYRQQLAEQVQYYFRIRMQAARKDISKTAQELFQSPLYTWGSAS